MPAQLLPASAAAFAPRASSANVVLGSKIEPWLTQTLKRINRVKRPLNNVPQHQRCLTETLSSPGAIWTLASLMLPTLPDAELPPDPVQRLFGYQLLHVEAYIVHVDMVLRHEVAFKLTSDSIDALIAHHETVHCPNIKAAACDLPDKNQQCVKLQADFVQAVNKFVFRTHVSALEGLEEQGVGELLCGKSEEVKTSLMALMKSLPPPPPRSTEALHRLPLVPASSPPPNLWSLPHTLPSANACLSISTSPGMTSSISNPASISHLWPGSASDDGQQTPISVPHSAADFFFATTPVTAPMPSLPLPSMLAPSQCGVSEGMGAFGWDRYQEYAATM